MSDLCVGFPGTGAQARAKGLFISRHRNDTQVPKPATGLFNYGAGRIDDHGAPVQKVVHGFRRDAVPQAMGPPGQKVATQFTAGMELAFRDRDMVLGPGIGRAGDIAAGEHDVGAIGKGSPGAVDQAVLARPGRADDQNHGSG